jgi:hypothetical protein
MVVRRAADTRATTPCFPFLLTVARSLNHSVPWIVSQMVPSRGTETKICVPVTCDLLPADAEGVEETKWNGHRLHPTTGELVFKGGHSRGGSLLSHLAPARC